MGWAGNIHEPQSSIMGSIPHDLNQSTFIYTRNNLNVWHLRPYYDTISHIFEHG